MKKISVIILSVLCALGIGCSVFLGIKYSNKSKQYRELLKEYNELVAMYNDATYTIDDLKLEVAELNSDYKEISTEHETLSSTYNELLETHNQLVSDYNELVEKYNEETNVQYETPTNLEDYATNITYNDLSRNPKEFEGKALSMDGEVVQLLESDGEVDIRLAVNGDYDEMVYIVYESNIIESRVLEGDDITFYGVYYGIYQYESTFGSTISIPLILVDYIEIN